MKKRRQTKNNLWHLSHKIKGWPKNMRFLNKIDEDLIYHMDDELFYIMFKNIIFILERSN